MRKVLLTLFYICCILYVRAQNYECLKPGIKQYFINSNSYLRGIRIDSTYYQWTTAHYYLFHTPRGRYLPTNQPNDTLLPLDLGGGSWIGKNVTSYGNGVWDFYTYWGDTVFIKAKANVGDSWTFYDDTSSYYYTAQVTGADTATILNVLDSVKTITLTAYHNAMVNLADMANNAKIIISKNHGFYQTCELYMFPLHEPGVPYNHGFDLFLDNLSYSGANSDNIIFKQVEFHNPNTEDIYNYNIGDVFEWEGDNSCLPYKRIDSIVGKDSIGPTHIQYTTKKWTWLFHAYPATSTTTFSTFTSDVFYGPQTLIDTTQMPEESVVTQFYYYNPGDSSQCYPGTLYGTSDNFIYGDNNGYYVNTFEPCGASFKYKCGFGKIYDAECFDPTMCAGDHFDQMTYSYKAANPNGPCGTFSPIPTSIKELKTREATLITPNPANDFITINNPNAPYKATFINMLGEPVMSVQCNKPTESITISTLPVGIYILKLQQSDGTILNRRIQVAH